MPKSNWELWGLVIAVVEFDVNYFVYSQTKSLLTLVKSSVFRQRFNCRGFSGSHKPQANLCPQKSFVDF